MSLQDTSTVAGYVAGWWLFHLVYLSMI